MVKNYIYLALHKRKYLNWLLKQMVTKIGLFSVLNLFIHFLQVIFLALNVHIKNVACTYSLEHKSIDDLFDSIFHYLDKLVVDDETISKQFQELVLCISTIQASICQHMLKEEEQVIFVHVYYHSVQ